MAAERNRDRPAHAVLVGSRLTGMEPGRGQAPRHLFSELIGVGGVALSKGEFCHWE
jgi:hypothetical protein